VTDQEKARIAVEQANIIQEVDANLAKLPIADDEGSLAGVAIISLVLTALIRTAYGCSTIIANAILTPRQDKY
jgi:hypothetical protein